MTTFITAGTLPKEYEDLRDTVADFARTVVAPVSAKHDEEHSFPYEVVAKMGEMGLFGLPFPEEYGGMGGDYFALALAVEELGKVDQSVAITLEAGASLGAMPIYRFGTEEQKRNGYPTCWPAARLPVSGSPSQRPARTPAAPAPPLGSTMASGSSTATSNSSPIRAPTSPRWSPSPRSPEPARDDQKEISTIVVPSGTPGFTVEPVYNKVGWNASDTHPLTFVDARVPEENLLGARGTGYANFLSILDEGRIAIAALATGAAQGCVDESVKYAKERHSFGQPIGSYQVISFKIARMEARAHVARTAYYEAAAKMLAGKPFKKEAAIAKMIASEAAMDNARDATQIHGGYGFMNDYPVARHYRDSKILEIGEGTTEVQLMLIARSLGLFA